MYEDGIISPFQCQEKRKLEIGTLSYLREFNRYSASVLVYTFLKISLLFIVKFFLSQKFNFKVRCIKCSAE